MTPLGVKIMPLGVEMMPLGAYLVTRVMLHIVASLLRSS
jgi:hypothetical protein